MTEEEALAHLHAEMPRQGPGAAEDVLWAIDRLDLSGPLAMVDAGCGPGADLETLARALPEAQVTGIDAFPHLVREANARVADLSNARAVEGDMAHLEGPIDVIWSAGAIYFLGVTEGLTAWRAALAPGGAVAFSEPVLLDPPRPPEVNAFWAQYPAITDLAGIEVRVRAAGYEVLGHRLIVRAAWAAYYDALAPRIAALRPGADAVLSRLLDDAEREVALWRAAPDHIAYALILARPV